MARNAWVSSGTTLAVYVIVGHILWGEKTLPTLGQFFSHFFVGCFGSSQQTCYVKYNIILSAASKAADKFVGCFKSSRQKND
jgi:hypothetical protein